MAERRFHYEQPAFHVIYEGDDFLSRAFDEGGVEAVERVLRERAPELPEDAVRALVDAYRASEPRDQR